MDLPERLVNQEKAISDLSHKIQYYQESHYFKRRKVPSLEAELTDKKEKQVNAVASFLEKEFAPFRELVEGNYELLEGSRVIFKLIHADLTFSVKSENRSSGSLIKWIRGAMHQNGYLYGHVITTQSCLQFLQYPSQLRGKIDYLGNMRFMRHSIKLSLINLPRAFAGAVGNRGITTMEITERELRQHYVYKNVVANAFVDDEEKRDQFVRNRNELYSIIEDTRKLLREVSNSE